MPKSKRKILKEDIMPLDVYTANRKELRKNIVNFKKDRRIALGPYATFYFENYETMLAQVHEMLYIEKGGDEQLKKRVIPLAEKLNSKTTFSCDVEKKEDVIKLFEDVKSQWGEIDFVVHAIAFSDKSELSGEYLDTTRENFLRSMLISCFSFTEIAKEASKVMKEGGSLITLSYEANKAIPNYNVMGVCKAALESSVKYLARDLGARGMRVNAISAGPIKTLAASAIGDAKFLYKWNEDHSFLKRNVDIHDVGNSALYLLSDLANGVTGEIHYVDAGYNKVGMPDPKNIT